MILATVNVPRRLLYINYTGTVTVPDLERALDELHTLLPSLPDGFRLLANLSGLEFMDPAGVDVIGRTMELLEKHGLELIARVIPDPSKDIGFKIIGIFHYKSRPRIIVCETLDEAGRALGW